jgi:hypothetical protein
MGRSGTWEYTRGWDWGTFLCHGQKNKKLKVSNLVCQPYLRIFPLNFLSDNFPPKIPGPVSQTKLKTKKIKKIMAEMRF